ncbi:MarR family winged helix-turn-helix transcriptional regulator [Deinococcus sonorensis]|uniref:MarR family winged helix-turn-helix transcriptional regulator n=2 Tax=Deinococcus sonorensis TaxID=309891 RepID=A0AAU7U6U2_9DEIO
MTASDDDILELGQTVFRFVQRSNRNQARDHDPVRVQVLALALTLDGVTPSLLAEQLELSPTSITRHVQALEDQGHVHVLPNPHDARSWLIRTSEAGMAELQRIARTGFELWRGVLHDWSAQDVATLTALLTRLMGDWDAHGPGLKAKSARRRRRVQAEEPDVPPVPAP